MLIAGALASEQILDVRTLAGVVVGAALLGDSVGYFLGRRFGRGFLIRHQRLFHISSERLEKADGYFERHGGKTIFFGRWVGFLRSLAPFLAGSARMSYSRFLFWDILGATSWGVTIVGLGYLAGRSYSLVEDWLGRISLFLVLFAVAVFAFYLLGKWLWARREELGGLAVSLSDSAMSRPWARWVRRRFGGQIDWVLRRFSPRQTFGLTLTAGLLTAIVLVWGFSVLTEWVLTKGPLSVFDREVAIILHDRAIPALTTVMVAITYLGSAWVVVPLSLAGGFFLLWRGRRLEAIMLLTAAPGAWLLSEILKSLIGRERPDFIEPLISIGGYAFPSGHATTATAFYLIGGILLASFVRRWETRVYVLLAALAIIVLVGFSRLYLGVHYLTDVLAGFVVGAFWVTVVLTATTTLGRALEAADGRAGAAPPDAAPAESSAQDTPTEDAAPHDAPPPDPSPTHGPPAEAKSPGDGGEMGAGRVAPSDNGAEDGDPPDSSPAGRGWAEVRKPWH